MEEIKSWRTKQAVILNKIYYLVTVTKGCERLLGEEVCRKAQANWRETMQTFQGVGIVLNETTPDQWVSEMVRKCRPLADVAGTVEARNREALCLALAAAHRVTLSSEEAKGLSLGETVRKCQEKAA